MRVDNNFNSVTTYQNKIKKKKKSEKKNKSNESS